MTNINPLHPLQSSILELLSSYPHCTVAALQEFLSRHDVRPSLATLYRLLREMELKQMIVRSHGKIQLHSVWLSHVAKFVERAKQHQKHAEGTVDIASMKDGESRAFFAESLMELDPVWGHILGELPHIERERQWYVYNSHPWYSLGMRETESRLYQGLVSEGISPHMLYGNDSFLDRYGEKIIRVKGFETRCTAETPFPKEGYALWCTGDYIVECIMPRSISQHFAFFFANVHTISQFDPELFADIFTMRSRCKVTVRRDPREEKKLREKIQGFFELH